MRLFCRTIDTQKIRKGFSFGEVLLAAFVLTVGLTATMALVSASIRHAYDNRDAIIAVQLAQEGIELVRNVRDQNFANEKDSIPSGQGFAGFTESDKHCRIGYDEALMTCFNSQGSPSNRQYFLDDPPSPASGGKFIHTASTRRFARYIYVDYSDPNKRARVVSYVFWGWTSGGSMPSYVPNNGNTANCTLQNKCVFSETLLTRWVR